MSNHKGKLYVVATPIGNLADMSYRAVEVLKAVDMIAAEDTRHSRPLLNHYGIQTPLLALHEHNEREMAPKLLKRLEQGESIALIADAGTPLISDPGFPLVRMARQAGLSVIPVPGPCALIAALSVAGLPTDRFAFEGFPPRTSAARRECFKALLEDPRTLIFYESSHRIMECIKDLKAVFPSERQIAIARELTKIHETIIHTVLAEVDRTLEQAPYGRKGEFVVILQGAPSVTPTLTGEQERLLQILLAECSVKTTVSLAAKITGLRKKLLYQTALKLMQTKG